MPGLNDYLRRTAARRKSFGVPVPGQIIGYRRDGRPIRLQAGGSGFTIVHQTTSQAADSGSGAAYTIPATAAGNCLVVCVATGQSGTGVTGITLGGSAGNFALGKASTVNLDTEIWTDQNCAGGQTALVISAGGSGVIPVSTAATIYEVSGVAASAALDQVSSNSSAGSTSFTSGATPTTTQASEIVFAAVSDANGGTITGPASGWTNTAFDGGVESWRSTAGFEILTGTGTPSYAGTLSASDPYDAVIITLKGTAAATSAPPAPQLIPPGRMSPMAFQLRPGSAPAPHADTDTGSGADTAAIALSDTDTAAGADTASVAVAGTDAGTGAETAVIAVSSTDSGTGLDAASVTEGASGSDAATGAESAAVAAAVPGSDAGAGAESGTVTATTTGSDTGSGVDTATVTVLGSDTSSGTDTAAVTTVEVASTDAGTGADAAAVTAAVSSGETASAADAGALTVTGADTGTGADSASATTRPVVLWKAADKLSKRGGTMQ